MDASRGRHLEEPAHVARPHPLAKQSADPFRPVGKETGWYLGRSEVNSSGDFKRIEALSNPIFIRPGG